MEEKCSLPDGYKEFECGCVGPVEWIDCPVHEVV